MSRVRTSISALIVAGLASACSSSNNATGTAGSSGGAVAGTTGAAGTAGGAGMGGAAGTGGGPSDAGAPPDGAFTGTPEAGVPYAAVCASTVRNRGSCMTAIDMQCANTCGPNRIGYKNCDCFTDVWDCPACEYRPGNYECYRLPDPLEACPPQPNPDPKGSTLPQVGSACTRAACSPCGSATLISYLDSAMAPKVGYCICGNEQKWTCASTTEWPQ